MKVVLQDGVKDCGICCLLSIIRFYGGDVPKEYLRELTNTTKEGTTLFNLLSAAKKIGFDGIGVEGNIEKIDVNNLPCIAHLNIKKNYKHFVVVYKINNLKKQITLMDPAKGKKVISLSEYNLLASNYYLLLKPKRKLPILKNKNIIIKNLLTITKENKQKLIIIAILTIQYFILNIITSYQFKYLMEYSINENITENLLPIVISLGIVYLIKNFTIFIRNVVLNKWNSLFSVCITTTTYKQILLLPYLYYKNRTTGEIVSRFQDLNKIRDYLTVLFCTITTDLLAAIIFYRILLLFNKKIILYINIILILEILYILITSKLKKKKIKKAKTSEDIINSYLIQGISNVDTIKGSHLEKRFIDKFAQNHKLFQERIYNYSNLLEIERIVKNNCNDLINLIAMGIGCYYVVKDGMKLSSLILLQSILNIYLNSINSLVSIFTEFNSFKISLQRIEELFMIDKENFQNNYFYLSYQLKGEIVIKKLTYKIGTKELFKNLNLIIKPGEKILLCGDSGSGKSTLMKILLRYIEIPYDVVKIANIDINHYHLQNIRKNITYITSNEYLFQDTIENNITLYQEYHEEEIKNVCDICCVTEILKEKNIGLSTIIEENGFNLSNGERQRIVLARGILKKTNIYILDEALGQIDINKEKKILENVFSYLTEKTIIVISHRFTNKKYYQRIIKLENGVIVENNKL